MGNEELKLDRIETQFHELKLEVAVLREKEQNLERELKTQKEIVNNMKGGIYRGLWILGGGFISSIVYWIINGGLKISGNG